MSGNPSVVCEPRLDNIKCRVLRRRELKGWASGEQEVGRQRNKDRAARAWATLGGEGVHGLLDVRTRATKVTF